MVAQKLTHDAVILIYWQEHRKVWRIVGRHGRKAVVHTTDAQTTHELDQVGIQRLTQAVAAEMESWLI